MYLLIYKINNFIEEKRGDKYLNIAFTDNNDDQLPLNKQFFSVAIVIRSVFEEDGKYYPQAFLDDCLYEL